MVPVAALRDEDWFEWFPWPRRGTRAGLSGFELARKTNTSPDPDPNSCRHFRSCRKFAMVVSRFAEVSWQSRNAVERRNTPEK